MSITDDPQDFLSRLDNEALIEAVASRLDKDPQFYFELYKSRRLRAALDGAASYTDVAELEEIAKQIMGGQAA